MITLSKTFFLAAIAPNVDKLLARLKMENTNVYVETKLKLLQVVWKRTIIIRTIEI